MARHDVFLPHPRLSTSLPTHRADGRLGLRLCEKVGATGGPCHILTEIPVRRNWTCRCKIASGSFALRSPVSVAFLPRPMIRVHSGIVGFDRWRSSVWVAAAAFRKNCVATEYGPRDPAPCSTANCSARRLQTWGLTRRARCSMALGTLRLLLLNSDIRVVRAAFFRSHKQHVVCYNVRLQTANCVP